MKWLKTLFAEKRDDRIDYEKLAKIMSLVNEQSQPNLNALLIAARNIEPISLNIKHFGYSLARQMAAALPPAQKSEHRSFDVKSKISTQADIESEWLAHWAAELEIPVIYHRKIWEIAFVLQAIYNHGCLREGARGLGFGCGEEVLPSYFAANGIAVTATDLPVGDADARGWVDTNQHTAHLNSAYHSHLVEREKFDALVKLHHVDMNDIPDSLKDYDFCWSICALEHLGSIDKGLAFIENSMKTLRPNGVSVHTTEFNVRSDGPTIDNWPTVLFQRRHFEELAERLTAAGHRVTPFDFDLGDKPLDKFIDLPPWEHEFPTETIDWFGAPLHLKVAIDGFVSTCFGIVVQKAG